MCFFFFSSQEGQNPATALKKENYVLFCFLGNQQVLGFCCRSNSMRWGLTLAQNFKNCSIRGHSST
jgi:hypothetical protein